MSDYIVLENIPNTSEGRAFLKQLRKYLRPQYKMRSRGRHADRKGLAKELVRKGVYCYADDKSVQEREVEVHHKLRLGMSCKYADRITTVIEARNERGITWDKTGYFVTWPIKQGPFRTWDAACLAQRMAQGSTN